MATEGQGGLWDLPGLHTTDELLCSVNPVCVHVCAHGPGDRQCFLPQAEVKTV